MRSNSGEKGKLTERDNGISEGNKEGKWAKFDDVYILLYPYEIHGFYVCLQVRCNNNNSIKISLIEISWGHMGKFGERKGKKGTGIIMFYT